MHVVTGAGGFVGHAIVRRLIDRGDPVRAVVRTPRHQALFSGDGVEVVVGQLEDGDVAARAVRGARVIYHCAAMSTDWAEWPAYLAANVQAVETLVSLAAGSAALSRFVHVSTTDVYGYPAVPCGEATPLRDVGLPYNRTKIASERLVRAAMADRSLDATVLRPATIYGPRAHAMVLEIAQLLRAGHMMLIDRGRAPGGFIYIDNFVDAALEAARRPEARGQAINLRDETAETWARFVADLADGIGAPHPRFSVPAPLAYGAGAVLEPAYRALRRRHRPLSTRHATRLLSRDAAFPIDAARRLLGFRSRVPYPEGMRRTVAWVQGCLEDTQATGS